jgi:hypothetical protein
MSIRRLPLVLLSLLILVPLLALTATAQQSSQPTVKPYHNGPVWNIAFVKVKAGMEDRYLKYLAGDWKSEQDAMKKAGYILDYKVIETEPHDSQDYGVILMTQYKDLATMEANEDKMEDLALQMFGGRPKVESGYEQRASYREIVGERLGREIVLEPRTTTTASK